MIVRGAGVDIATRDHGGDGPTLLLTHGLGGEQSHLDPIAKRLATSCRIVTFDMRNHGASGEGEWSWPDVLADVAAVRDAYELRAPIVGGHSLGGMVGALFAEAHPDTRAVINLDGHGQGRPYQYDGLSEAEVIEGQKRLNDAQIAISGPPSPQLQQTLDVLKDLFMFEHYERLQCPLLVFNATGVDPITNIEGLEWAGPFMAAYRRGLARDLAALAATHPNVEVETIDASHYFIFGEADAAAQRIERFVSTLPD